MDDITGPHRYRRNHIWQCLPWQATRRCDLQQQTEKRKEQDTDNTIAEDNMNCQLRDITVTARDGRVSHLDQVYIRGSHVRYFIVPDMLRLVERQLSEKGAMLTISQQKCAHVQSKKCAWKRCWSGQRSRYRQQSQRPKRWTPWINGRDKHLVLIMNTRKRESQKFHVGRAIWLWKCRFAWSSRPEVESGGSTQTRRKGLAPSPHSCTTRIAVY
jgi:hypothetical protein